MVADDPAFPIPPKRGSLAHRAQIQPCPSCGTKQIEFSPVDSINTLRDIFKCRHCKLRASREVWVRLHAKARRPPQRGFPFIYLFTFLHLGFMAYCTWKAESFAAARPYFAVASLSLAIYLDKTYARFRAWCHK